jgi:Domain of unknown function (DUF4303)
MSINYKEFKAELKDKTRATFVGCLDRLSVQEIAGFALYSDASAMTISVSCNTVKHLKEMQEEEEGHNAYFKWSAGEWKYETINAKEFTGLTNLLQKENTIIGSNQGKFIENRNLLFNTAVEVLEELKKEGLFDKMTKEFVLMFGISDFSDAKLEINFANRLNNEAQAKEFENWLLSEADAD